MLLSEMIAGIWKHQCVREWSFGDHSITCAAAFSGERVEQEPITQCPAVPVPAWDPSHG